MIAFRGIAFFLVLAFLIWARPAVAHETSLPLGDGKISDSPEAGYIWSCQQDFDSNAPGAQRNGDWIQGKVWYPGRKLHVRGSVRWDSQFTISVEDGFRFIRANSLPDHPTGVFPVRRDDPAYLVDRNPNAISDQVVAFSLPLDPEVVSPSCLPMGMIGIALTGTAIFNGLDAGGRDAAAHEIQDNCDGHPERQGQYHYHNYSACLRDKSGKAGRHSDLVGYALDGFGIYGLKGENGKELQSADLDACHGHKHVVTWNGVEQDVYHYHMTPDYPYTLGCFMGAAPQVHGVAGGAAFDRKPAQNRAPFDPEVTLRKAAEILHVSPATLRNAVGPPPPDFGQASGVLGIPEENIKSAFDRAMAGD